MPTLNEAVDALAAEVGRSVQVIASAIEDLKNPTVDNSEAIARLDGAKDALKAANDALNAADPTPAVE